MESDQEILLRAIRANPDDDAPRLAYADWLDENNQPERAEFIRRQHELRVDNGFCGIDGKFSAAHDAWCYELFCFGGREDLHKRVIFRRGFIDEIHCTVDEWIANGPMVTGSHPVQVLRLTDVRVASERAIFDSVGTIDEDGIAILPKLIDYDCTLEWEYGEHFYQDSRCVLKKSEGFTPDAMNSSPRALRNRTRLGYFVTLHGRSKEKGGALRHVERCYLEWAKESSLTASTI